MINNITLVGRMTRDPELRRTSNGTAVTSFDLAVGRDFTGADGVDVDYIPCVVWGKIGESVEKYCSKGSLVAVTGRLQTRSYQNTDGQKIKVFEVVCDKVQFLDKKTENAVE